MHVLVIRHHVEDSAGFIGEAFTARGASLAVHLFPKEGDLPAPEQAGHIVVLGASYSVYDTEQPRIADELAWLRRADEAGVPVLGICFGAQAMTEAFGGRVTAAARKEIGWTTISTDDPDTVPAGPWLEFHGDQCHPPRRARVLARNEVGVQAFTLGRHLAVQFHPEVDGAQLRGWLDAGGRADAERAGVDPDALVAETVTHEAAARERAYGLVATALRLAGTG